MALSAVALASRALLKIGAKSINGFDDGTVEAEVAGALYAPIRDALLSSHPWSFATAQIILPKLDDAPVADYDNAFQLPNDFLRALSTGVSGRGRGVDYRIQRQTLHTNAEDVILSYIYRPAEAEFPPFFDAVLMARLAAEFCLPITESASRAQVLFKLADDEFSRAKQIDSQQSTPQAFEDYSLIEARS